MYFIILFATVVQVLAHDAPVQIDSLPISANFKPLKGGSTLVDRDRARFRSLFTRHEKRAQSVGLKNTAVSQLALSIECDVKELAPGALHVERCMWQIFIDSWVIDELLIDTGSAYTWIGAAKKYVETKASIRQTNQSFYAAYGSGSAVGAHYKDQVTLSPSLVISNKSFGVASSTDGVDGSFDGILGLGPTGLGKNVVTPNNGKPVPTIMDALLAQKKIEHNMFGISFTPTKSRGTIDGELTFGGYNAQKLTGKLNWTLQSSSTGVVDTGTTLIYITPKAFKVYSESLPGSKIDQSTKLLEIPKDSVGKMKSLFFVINGIPYEFTPNAQLWPRTLNTALGGKADAYYSVISPLSDFEADTGSSFINGYAFLERFYSAYDASKSMIGFATTSSTTAEIN
ncbi:Eukaryotic aspartyl protease [Rhizoctonia solani]|uniref:Eukaryotic aspartyl protease n=1 Tax=Rhizoctonia solani TaxID=456999 RepID=A0A8H7I670_9AGAM|nr:Eukaryotic aspartyl protease [Rhizoctonia solani]